MYKEICDTLIWFKTLVVVYDSSFKYVSTELKPARIPHLVVCQLYIVQCTILIRYIVAMYEIFLNVFDW